MRKCNKTLHDNRIPSVVKTVGHGYLEDRRPSSNMDPYMVTGKLVETCCLWDGKDDDVTAKDDAAMATEQEGDADKLPSAGGPSNVVEAPLKDDVVLNLHEDDGDGV